MARFLKIAGTLAASLLIPAASMPAQTSAPAKPGFVTGIGNLIHSVADLDKTVAFYHDALGLNPDIPAGRKAPAGPPVPRPLNEAISKFTGTQGAKFRATSLKIPNAGFDLELTEFSGISHKTAIPANQDPGAATLVLTVRDASAALDAVKKAGGQVVTKGGEPVQLKGNSRSVFVRDPDGFFLELFQPDPLPQSAASSSGMVLGGRFGTTVRNTEKTLEFFQNVFGFQPEPGGPFAKNPAIAKLVDVPASTEFRMSRAKVPGTSIDWEFIEYKGVSRKPFELPSADPGAPAFTLHVNDIDAAVKNVKAAGGSTASTGGVPQKLGRGTNIFVRDPDGLLLELIQP